jgi:transcriptional regulator with XRE-family HTH domain
VLNGSEVSAIEGEEAEEVEIPVLAGDSGLCESTACSVQPAGPNEETGLWGTEMKKRGPVQETRLAVFVTERLAELGMKQSEFCRMTGFDQGLLSKIQSSMISHLNLETALRLASGLAVSPKTIFELIGRVDLHALIVRAYSSETVTGVRNDDASDAVGRITQLALQADAAGMNLTPVADLLNEMLSARRSSRFHFIEERQGNREA